ncbi:hypothetical protein GH714_031937 [Hevea brasiliensis]|uniref:Uncharacterized protein n=1 Tax=Hevea brasiliensis TaxID=3981 RepID=A0A6A6LEK1_HEVBR|nr:hypothetical protein GH714_031937 [Hevea brasiliensis]
MADSDDQVHEAGTSVMEGQAAGARRKGRAKFRDPSRAREEMGDVETRLAKVELHLVNGDERCEELENWCWSLLKGWMRPGMSYKLPSTKPLWAVDSWYQSIVECFGKMADSGDQVHEAGTSVMGDKRLVQEGRNGPSLENPLGREKRWGMLRLGMDETWDELQAALNEALDKVANESEALRIAHAEEVSTMREENRLLKEEVEKMNGEKKDVRDEMVLLRRELGVEDDAPKVDHAPLYLAESTMVWWRRRMADMEKATCSIKTAMECPKNAALTALVGESEEGSPRQEGSSMGSLQLAALTKGKQVKNKVANKGKLFAQLKIGQNEVQALVDTGASNNFLKLEEA